MQNSRPGTPTPASITAPATPSQQTDSRTAPPSRIAVADTVSQAALAGMLGILNGTLPLKHARVAHAMGELAIRGVVVAQEYEPRAGFDLPGLPEHPAPPPASGEAVD